MGTSALWFENVGMRPSSLWYSSSKLERSLGNLWEPDGSFLSTLPLDAYLLNTYYILNPTLGIVDIF